MEFWAVGAGGFLGAIARFAMMRTVSGRIGEGWPWGTFSVNVLGALVAGAVVAILAERGLADSHLRLFLVVGFLGGYTTFSAYTVEAITLAEQGDWFGAASYLIGSNVVGLVACIAGFAIGRALS